MTPLQVVSSPDQEPNRGQETVWAAALQAFKEEEGTAFLTYPIYRQDGLCLHTPDVLLVLRRFGVFVIECKGCQIGQIERIDGPRWTMRDWHSETEAPVDQVNRQLFALKDVLDREPALKGRLRLHARVALPFIREDEWAARGYIGLAVAGNVACAEACTPEGLRAWVKAAHAQHPQPPLDETAWATLLKQFRRRAPVLDGGTRPVRYVYREAPPPAERIAEELGITLHQREQEPPSYTYVVATAALSSRRKRDGFGLQHQRDPHPRPRAEDPDEPHLVFHHVVRILLGAPVLTRAEEQTLVARAAQAVARGDEAAAAALRHDVFAWRDALRQLDEHGYDLGAGLPPEVADHVVHPEVGRVLRDLQGEYHALQKQEQKRPFEAAARAFLEGPFRPTPLVVMEGFSRLTPLQRLFLDQCCRHGARVALIHPYNAEQALGFDAIRGTYADWWEDPPVTLPTGPFESPDSLATLKTHLFAREGPEETPPADGCVTAEAFAHRNREVAACVRRVQTYLEEGVYEPGDLTVVSRDPAGYGPLLLEEAEMQGIADLFAIPPRDLLLTPLGRFVLTLYEVWRADKLELSAEAFETVLASGWLGSKAQASADAFAAAAPQLFARCRTYDDWTGTLALLETVALRKGSRMPIASVPDHGAELWRWVLGEIVRLCQRLFSVGPQSIGAHIRTLLDELEQLDPKRIRTAEREVLARIEEVLAPLTEGASIEMTAEEFGAVLNRLGREEPEDDGLDDKRAQVRVTSPEGIDGTERCVVFYLGADDRRLPRGYSDPWPLYDDALDAHRAQERYLFLAVVRAATERLHLSFPLVAGGKACRPSLYLEEAVRLLGLEVEHDVEEKAEGADPAPCPHPLPGTVWRPRYGLHEVAQFFLCPYRYHLERLDPKARRYHTAWQVPFVAKATWLRYLLAYLHRQGAQGSDPEDFRRIALAALDETEPRVRRLFGGLRDLDWLSARRDVEHELGWQMSTRFEGKTYPVSVARAPQATYEIPLDDRHVTVDVTTSHAFRSGWHLYPYVTDTRDEEWLRYGSGDANPTEPLDPSEDLNTSTVDESRPLRHPLRRDDVVEPGHEPRAVARAPVCASRGPVPRLRGGPDPPPARPPGRAVPEAPRRPLLLLPSAQ